MDSGESTFAETPLWCDGNHSKPTHNTQVGSIAHDQNTVNLSKEHSGLDNRDDGGGGVNVRKKKTVHRKVTLKKLRVVRHCETSRMSPFSTHNLTQSNLSLPNLT